MPFSEWFISSINVVNEIEFVLHNKSLKLERYFHLVYCMKRQTISIGLSKLISNHICKLTKIRKFFDRESTSKKRVVYHFKQRKQYNRIISRTKWKYQNKQHVDFKYSIKNQRQILEKLIVKSPKIVDKICKRSFVFREDEKG